MDERSAIVKIGGQEYEMLLTTNATKEIAGRYGGLDNLGDKLMKSENFEMALDKSCRSSHCYATRPFLYTTSSIWLMPFGLLMDLWECHRQYNGISKPKQNLTIDDVIPYGI